MAKLNILITVGFAFLLNDSSYIYIFTFGLHVVFKFMWPPFQKVMIILLSVFVIMVALLHTSLDRSTPLCCCASENKDRS